MPVILLDVNDSEMSDAKSLFLVREILPVSSTTTKKCGQNVMKESYPLRGVPPKSPPYSTQKPKRRIPGGGGV